MAEMDEEEDLGPNNTLDGLLRRLDDGKAINELGHELQNYIAELRRDAKRKGRGSKGKVVLELSFAMGADGYVLVTPKMTTKPIARPPKPDSTLYTDEDGDINGLRVPKQVSIHEVKNKGKDPAAPAAKGI